MVERFHKAARDGYLDVIREATRRDCNNKDEDGMTPTLWAAFEGNLDALRLLVSRGGDPEKCDNYGNTALHLASAKGHLSCVTFLVNFGVNIWDLDIDQHTSKDLAAINSKEDILKFLDSAGAVQESSNPKLVKSQQEKAKKEAEKRIKAFQKLQAKADKLATKEDEKLEKERRRMSLFPGQDDQPSTTAAEQPKRRASIGGALLGTVGRRDSKLVAPPQTMKYSQITGTVNSSKMRSGVFKKLQQQSNKPAGEFTIRDSQGEGRGTVRNMGQGLRRDSEIIFMKKEDPDVELNLEDDQKANQYISEKSSIFSRPGFGSMAFRKSISAFNHLSINEVDRKEDSIGSAGSLANRSDNTRMEEVSEEEDDLSDDDDQGLEYTSLQMFLAATGLSDWIPSFLKERIDLDALMLLTESDLGDVLGMPLGPRKKLMKAISDRKAAIENPDVITDSRL